MGQISETKAGTFSIWVRSGPVTVDETLDGGPFIRPAGPPSSHNWRQLAPADLHRDDFYSRLSAVSAELVKSGPKFGSRRVYRYVEDVAGRFGPILTPMNYPTVDPDEYPFWWYARLAIEVTAYVQTLGRLEHKSFASLPEHLREEHDRLERAWPRSTALWKTPQEAANPSVHVARYLARNPQVNRKRALANMYVFPNPWSLLRAHRSNASGTREFRTAVVDDLSMRFGNGLNAAGVYFSAHLGLSIFGNICLAAWHALALDWAHAEDIGVCKGCGRFFVRRSKHDAECCSDRCRRNKNRRAKQRRKWPVSAGD